MSTRQLRLDEMKNNQTLTAVEAASILADTIAHKKKGFSDRVVERVNNGGIEVDTDGDSLKGIVPGSLDGDEYSSYTIDLSNTHLELCSCYSHNFGVARARRVCTHVGAVLVKHTMELSREDSDMAENELTTHAEALDESAQEYISHRERIESTSEDLNMAEKFSENWEQRAVAQATKMEQVDPGKWETFGGENDGHEVWVSSTGYQCKQCGDKFPTPCKLGAYILNKM